MKNELGHIIYKTTFHVAYLATAIDLVSFLNGVSGQMSVIQIVKDNSQWAVFYKTTHEA